MAATTNGDAAAALEDIKPPEGVILPPKEFKSKVLTLYLSMDLS